MEPFKYETLANAAKGHNAVVLTEKDFSTLLEHGMVVAILPDKTKYTSYSTGRTFGHGASMTQFVFLTTSVEDNGTRYPVFVHENGRVVVSNATQHLPLYDGVVLPYTMEQHRGESWKDIGDFQMRQVSATKPLTPIQVTSNNMERKLEVKTDLSQPAQDFPTREKVAAKHQQQQTLDWMATIVGIKYGFVTHPRYNEIADSGDAKAVMDMVEDEFRQLNGYIDTDLKANDLLPFPERYTDPTVRECLVDFGRQYAEYYFRYNKLPSYADCQDLFRIVKDKHFNET